MFSVYVKLAVLVFSFGLVTGSINSRVHAARLGLDYAAESANAGSFSMWRERFLNMSLLLLPVPQPLWQDERALQALRFDALHWEHKLMQGVAFRSEPLEALPQAVRGPVLRGAAELPVAPSMNLPLPPQPSLRAPPPPWQTSREERRLSSRFYELLLCLAIVAVFAFFYFDQRRRRLELSATGPQEDVLLFREWRHSWWSCFGAPVETNCMALCCPCIRWAETLSYVQPFTSFWLLLLLYGALWALARLGWFSFAGYVVTVSVCTYFRQHVREQYQMENGGSSCLTDCALYSCCCCCAMVQEARHVEDSIRAGHPASRPDQAPTPVSLSHMKIKQTPRAPHYSVPEHLAPASASQMEYWATVPPGVSEGSTIRFVISEDPHQEAECAVPAGMGPGDRFKIRV